MSMNAVAQQGKISELGKPGQVIKDRRGQSGQ